MNERNLFLTVLEARMPKIEVLENLESGTASLCVSLCIRGKVPMADSTASSTELYLYDSLLSPKAPFFKASPFELGFQGDTAVRLQQMR